MISESRHENRIAVPFANNNGYAVFIVSFVSDANMIQFDTSMYSIHLLYLSMLPNSFVQGTHYIKSHTTRFLFNKTI